MTEIMTTRLEVKQGCLAEFYQVMEHELIPLLNRHVHQKLLAAYKTVIGPSNHEVVHVWEVEDANMCMERSAILSKDPELAVITAKLKDLVVHERFSLVTPTPYSPR